MKLKQDVKRMVYFNTKYENTPKSFHRFKHEHVQNDKNCNRLYRVRQIDLRQQRYVNLYAQSI